MSESQGPAVLIRAAASGAIGAGHVARTAAVARELIAGGVRIVWACDSSTVPYLLQRGVQRECVRVLVAAATEGHSGERELPGMAQDNDADEVLSIMKATSARAVMVDSYLLGARWQGRIRTACPHLVVFDDLVDRQIEAAIAINAAGDRGMYGRLAPGALVLCGLEYAVVHAPRTLPPRLDRPGAVLVAFGASDRANATSAVLSALRATRRDDDPFDTWIQLGADAPHRGQVQQAADTLGWARLLDPGESIDADRRNISIAIGASGVSLYERMRDGIPGIMVPLAENQRRIAMAAQSCGAAVIARSESEAAGIAIALRRSISKLREMSRSGRSAVDGLGAKRIAATISACFA